MMAGQRRRSLLPLAGMVFGPVAWAANTQAGQILPYAECGGHARPSLWLSAVAVVLSLLGSFLSWRGVALNREDRCLRRSAFGFAGSLGALLGLLFALALLLQGLAPLLLTGCER